MFCQYCTKPLPSEADSCPECGRAINDESYEPPTRIEEMESMQAASAKLKEAVENLRAAADAFAQQAQAQAQHDAQRRRDSAKRVHEKVAERIKKATADIDKSLNDLKS